MPIHIEPAAPSDAADCIRVRGLTRENSISEERLRSLGITEQSWARDIETGSLPGFVCRAGGVLVGYCFGSRDTGEVKVLALLPDFENQGIGRRLLGLVVDLLRNMGHKRFFLGCSPDAKSRSYGFYRHLGWSSTGRFEPNGDEILELLAS